MEKERADSSNVVFHKGRVIASNHGFSTRVGGVSKGMFESLNLGMKRGDSDSNVIENYRRFFDAANITNESFVCGNQVHGVNVHVATKADLRKALEPGRVIEADGFVTKEANVPLVIFTADCVPVLLEDKENHVIGAVHCGWKSTVADIEKEAIDKMTGLGAKPVNISAEIGPSIDRCCFEVGPEVIEAVNALLKEDSSYLYSKKENGKYMLDLRGVVKKRLLQLGLKEENIEDVGECTMCHPDLYFSHRYTQGNRGSLATVIELSDY